MRPVRHGDPDLHGRLRLGRLLGRRTVRAVSAHDLLLVTWRDGAGFRRQIGRLWRGRAGYHFEYERSVLPQGFRLLPAFPERGDRYFSEDLFPMFAERVPHPRRPDFQRMMAEWEVEDPGDLMEVLARSGGRLATDRVETLPDGYPLARPTSPW